MFYSALARQLKPGMQKAAREARSARTEFQETVRWSDGFLLLLIVGSTICIRVYEPKTREDFWCWIGMFTLGFVGYVGLKSWEQTKEGGALKQYLGRVD